MCEEKEDVSLREYQVELLNEIMRLNSCILFLPTGSGKTYIALWLIKSMVADLKKSIDKGGKRTFFLVNSVQLVHQQQSILSKLGNFEVLALTGDSGVDNFRKSDWIEKQDQAQVFVMTAQIYLNAVTSSFLKLENANLLIFDECHHATGSHPMAEVMKLVQRCPFEKKPKILGLSATLLNANVKKSDEFYKKLNELESMYNGKIITSKKCRQIRDIYAAKPNERIINLSKYQLSPQTEGTLASVRDSGKEVLKIVKLKDNIVTDDVESCEVQLFKPGLNRSKLLKGALDDILVHTKEYGLYVGCICCQYYIVQLYRYMFVSCESQYIDTMLYTINLTQMMRKVLFTSIKICSTDDFESIGTIVNTSCEKLKYLFNRLKCITSDDRCIIFVQRKMTAKSLFKIVKIFAEKMPESKVKVDFIVGSDSNPLRNTREGLYDRKKQKKILQKFRSGIVNVLISTDVLEEGIDIQECNLVIMFDPMQTFRSYIQSKGRARMKNGEFIVLDDSGKDVSSQVQGFKKIDELLNEVMYKKDIYGDDDSASTENKVETYTTQAGATTNSISAISKIYMYCSTLPKDLFTNLVPYWFYNKNTGTCSVKLPSNSPIRTRIQGPPRSNRKEARQAVALEAVKQLHQIGALDDNLMPIRTPKELLDIDYWFPNRDVEDEEKQKRAKANELRPDVTFCTLIRTPKFLKNSRPLPNIDCYLHIIHTKTMYKLPEMERHRYCHELMTYENSEFGILTREPLPFICKFPTYTDLGEVQVTIEENAQILKFSGKELREISDFHKTLFLDVLKVVPKCFAYDEEEEANGYFIVPLRRSKETGLFKLSRKCIERKLEREVKKPDEETIKEQQYTIENYVGKVVSPWYLPHSPQCYIVCCVSGDKKLSSDFNSDKFKTYDEYYSKKYGLTSLRPHQPLLLVRPITGNLDGISPKPFSASQKRRRNKKEDDDNIYLPPEYCHVYSFPSIYWYKSIILPSVLHRMYYLLMAEELRQKIHNEAEVGSLKVQKEKSLRNVPVITKPQEPKSLKKNKLLGRMKVDQKRDKKIDDEIKIKDIFRESCVNIEDIKQFAEFVESPVIPIFSNVQKMTSNLASASSEIFEPIPTKMVVDFVESPNLFTLNEYGNEYDGPQACQILEAITLKTTGDAFNLERLETLGDSLLKYLVSISTYKKCATLNEGHLTVLKSQLVSNQNLFYCGKSSNIDSFAKAVTFTAKSFWCPPGFSVPRILKNEFPDDWSALILNLDIPFQEKFSGILSKETIDALERNTTELKDEDGNEKKLIDFYLGKITMKRKDLSDILEALLGLYLENCGIKEAFKLMKYFGILKYENLEELLAEVPFPSPPPGSVDVSSLMPDYEDVEKLCNYRFKNKFLLLEAFTHPSFSNNPITDCYQKLEFIGDAILDFLITSYIYQYCDELPPGQLTDLRSSLVNNNTFGALVVRLQLHKYLLCHSQRLLDAIENFVSYQESKQFEIHGNELMLLINEDDATIAEEVDVPKALGDIFESLAGAIYLDSGHDLQVVWNVYYPIMRKEIDKFSENIPINPVRALYEHVPSRVKFCNHNPKVAKDTEEVKEKFKVSARVTVSKEIREYRGRGDTVKTAKRAAAKYALKELNYNEFVI